MPSKSEHIAIVGAGFGGLAAAVALAAAGERVTLFEAGAALGGKARRMPSAAGPVDAGPTVFTMRGVFDEIFALAGARLEDRIGLVPAAILARHVWGDGSVLDLHPDPRASEAAIEAFAGPAAAAEFRAFSARARMLFRTFEAPVMRNGRPTPLGVARTIMGDPLRLVPAIAPHRTLWGAVERQFGDPRLRQLFARYATYIGGSPFLSPAILMLIWQAEAEGVWYLRQGMAGLAAVLAELAAERGAAVRCDTPVAAIETEGGRVAGLRLASGERVAAGTVVFNGDPAALGEGLLGPAVAHVAPALVPRERSLSAWVWAFAGRPRGVDLAHHTVFFSDDYRAEFEALSRDRRRPADPTIYVCASDRGFDAAPDGPERLLLIMNSPADGDRGRPSPEEIERCTTATFGRLAASGLDLTPPDPQTALTVPADFARLFPGSAGAIYGRAPHGATATFRRPLPRTRLPGLYLAGGGVHPGAGMAMAALSGRLAAEAIFADRASTRRWVPAAMPGGMSTGSRPTAPARSR